MAKFLFYCSLFAVIYTEGIQCKGHRKVKQSNDNDVKIVGGNETTIETYPYQAYLLLFDGRDYYQCGGSIISKNYVVTAAHCLERMQRIYVRIGTTNSESGGTQYETTVFYSHPLYNSRTYDYDAGIIRVSRGMNLDGTNARAITMVDSGYDPKEDEDIIVTGWGATAENGNTSSTLIVVQVPVVPRTRCNEFLSNSITSRMFCAGVTEGGKDTCQGDSGGPAVTNTTRLAGITSFGYGCARPNTPGVYTLVGNRSVRSFIRFYSGL